MTELHPRECLVRLMANGQVIPAIKARTMDAPVVTERRVADIKRIEQVLPEKFVENTSTGTSQLRQIKFSKALLDKIAESESRENSGQVAAPYQPPSRFGGVRDLLAMHSSSRAKVNNKDKQ